MVLVIMTGLSGRGVEGGGSVASCSSRLPDCGRASELVPAAEVANAEEENVGERERECAFEW
jgi:hypothetical protein